jgi:hypothetical protein
MILRLRHHHHHHLPLRGNASATVVQRCVPPLCGGLMCGILLEAEQEGLYFLNNVPSFFMFWPRRSGAKTCVRGVVHCPWCPNTSGPGVPGPKQAFAPLRSKGAKGCFGTPTRVGLGALQPFAPLLRKGAKWGSLSTPPKVPCSRPPRGRWGPQGDPP